MYYFPYESRNSKKLIVPHNIVSKNSDKSLFDNESRQYNDPKFVKTLAELFRLLTKRVTEYLPSGCSFFSLEQLQFFN